MTATASLTETITASATPTASPTPAFCPTTRSAQASQVGSGAWTGQGSSPTYSAVASWAGAAAAVDAQTTLLADNDGGVMDLQDEDAWSGAVGPVWIEVLYRANNAGMRLQLDYNATGSAGQGQLAGGPMTIVPPNTGWNTHAFLAEEAQPWSGLAVSAARVFLRAFSTSGGANRDIDIDHVRLVYDPCFAPSPTPTRSRTASPTLTRTPSFSHSPTQTRSFTVTGTPTPGPGLQDALDRPGTLVTSGGDAAWAPVAAPSYDGMDAAQAGPLADGQSTWMQTEVGGPAVVRFWWRSSTEPVWDLLSLSVDGVVQAGTLSGNQPWQQRELVLGPGPHTLRWTYTKDGSVSQGADSVWVDQLQVLDGTPTRSPTPTPVPAGSPTVSPTPTASPTQVVVLPPFLDGFESGALGAPWRLGGSGRTRAEDLYAPYEGAFQLLMDSPTAGQAASNHVDLVLDLGATVSPVLEFWVKSLGDEPHALPAAFSGSADGDGVAVSGDGVNWTRLESLAPVLFTWERRSYDLNSAISAAGVTDRGQVWIRLQQHDDGPAPGDGLAFDLVQVQDGASTPTPSRTITRTFTVAASPTTPPLPSHSPTPFFSPTITETSTPSATPTPSPTRTPSFTASPTFSVTPTPQRAGFPFFDGFEGAALDPWWQVGGTSGGRVRIDSGFGPYEGLQHLTFDAVNNGVYALNEAVLHLDLSGAQDPLLRWAVRSYGEDHDPLPLSFTGSVAGDGVSVSGDGVAWRRIDDAAAPGAYVVREVLLPPVLAAAGIADWSRIQVKFQQYDNYPFTTDGLAVDAVELLVQPSPTPTASPSPTRSPTGTATPSATRSPTFSHSPTHSVSPTVSETGTISPTFTLSPTFSVSPTQSPSFSASPSATGTPTATATATIPPSQLPEAVDLPGQPIAAGGDAPWFLQGAVTYFGGDAARSGAVGHGQSSWMESTFVGPGTVRFFWRASSEADFDLLSVAVDGVDQGGAISGNTAWAERSLSLGPGPRTVRWTYAKDAVLSQGLDAGFVDQLRFDLPGSPTITPTVTPTFTASPTVTPTPPFLVSADGVPRFGPVPVARGRRLCLYAGQTWRGGQVRLYNFAGERVLQAGLPPAPLACLETWNLAPGVYLAVLELDLASGQAVTGRQKLVILPD